MLLSGVSRFLEGIPYVQQIGKWLARQIHQLVLNGGKPARDTADMLHGTWLGHPLHPVLTDAVIGAWSMAAIFDLMSIFSKSRSAARAADMLTNIGNVSALPTALSGLADFSTIPQPAAGVALTHASVNNVGLVLYLLSSEARKRGQRGTGIALSSAGLGLLMTGAYLGGHLVYHHKVGVRRSGRLGEPADWTIVMPAAELSEQKRIRVDVEGHPVMLYQSGDTIYAIGAVCPHAGGPLEEGEIRGTEVRCPWHDSVFDLRDGCIVHGPSTYPAPNYDVRVRNEQIEVRAAE